METVSQTDLVRKPAAIFRRARRKPVRIEHRGQAHCMLVPADVLARVRKSDLPATARRNRQDITAWLATLLLRGLLAEHPDMTAAIMRQTVTRYREAASFSTSQIDRIEQLLDAGPALYLRELMQDSDAGAHLRQIWPFSALFGVSEQQRIRETVKRLRSEMAGSKAAA